MSQILQFNHQEFGQLTVLEKDGEFFFLGKEVAEKLGYSNTRDAIARHVEHEDKADVGIHDGRQMRNMTAVNESGLYSLILSSRLPTAKRFKHWVTREVLPSIRKHGGYIQGQEYLEKEEILAKAMLIAKRVIEEKEEKIEELKPKANYYDKLVDKNLLMNFRNTAKALHIPQKVFINYLLDNGYLYRDKYKRLLPYADKNHGYFEVKEWVSEDGRLVGIQTMVTPKGRSYFLLLLGGE